MRRMSGEREAVVTAEKGYQAVLAQPGLLLLGFYIFRE